MGGVTTLNTCCVDPLPVGGWECGSLGPPGVQAPPHLIQESGTVATAAMWTQLPWFLQNFINKTQGEEARMSGLRSPTRH